MILLAALVYASAILLCAAPTAFALRAWTRARYWHKSPSDLHYIVCSAAVLASAGFGALLGSNLTLLLGVSQ